MPVLSADVVATLDVIVREAETGRVPVDSEI